MSFCAACVCACLHTPALIPPINRTLQQQHRRERIDYAVLGRRDCSCQAFAQDQARSSHPRVRLAVSLSWGVWLCTYISIGASRVVYMWAHTHYPPIHPSITQPNRNGQCKHVLAVRLAGALGRLEEQEVPDDGFEAYCQLGYAA